MHESLFNERTTSDVTKQSFRASKVWRAHATLRIVIFREHQARPIESLREFTRAQKHTHTALIRGAQKGPLVRVIPLLSPQPRLLSSAISLYETRQQRIRLFLYCRDYYPPPTLSFRSLMRARNCALPFGNRIQRSTAFETQWQRDFKRTI